MPIVEHPTVCYRNRYGLSEPCQVVQCDFCGVLCHTVGDDIGEAATEARKKGFTTVKGEPMQSMKWWCGKCRR